MLRPGDFVRIGPRRESRNFVERDLRCKEIQVLGAASQGHFFQGNHGGWINHGFDVSPDTKRDFHHATEVNGCNPL